MNIIKLVTVQLYTKDANEALLNQIFSLMPTQHEKEAKHLRSSLSIAFPKNKVLTTL